MKIYHKSKTINPSMTMLNILYIEVQAYGYTHMLYIEDEDIP